MMIPNSSGKIKVMFQENHQPDISIYINPNKSPFSDGFPMVFMFQESHQPAIAFCFSSDFSCSPCRASIACWSLSRLEIEIPPASDEYPLVVKHGNGETHFFMGKFSISTGSFSIVMLVITRGYLPEFIWWTTERISDFPC